MTSSPAASRRTLLEELAPSLLFAVAFLLFIFRIETPPIYQFDEVYHAYTASQYVAHNADAYVWYTKAPRKGVAYTWNHPPLGLHLISWGVYLWGDRPLGWRFMSAVFGAAGVAIGFLFGRALSRRAAVGLLVAVLFMADGLYLVQSRTGMLDIFGTVFMLLAFYALHRALTVPPARALLPILVCGLCLSLAMATKWNAVYPAALVGAWLLARTVWLAVRARTHAEPDAWRGAWAHAAGLLGLIVLPPLVYLGVHIPFFRTGHSFAQFIELQKQTLYYHSHLHATHPYQSTWWQWPLALRPVWYWTSGGPGPKFGNVFALGNPLIAWALVPAVLGACVLAWRRRDMALLAVLVIGFFGQWLPWALVPRIAFAYHFLPATTIGIVAIALVLVALADRGGRPRTLAIAYGIAVIAAAVWFYPMRTGVPLTGQEIEARMWLRSWH